MTHTSPRTPQRGRTGSHTKVSPGNVVERSLEAYVSTLEPQLGSRCCTIYHYMQVVPCTDWTVTPISYVNRGQSIGVQSVVLQHQYRKREQRENGENRNREGERERAADGSASR